MQSAIEAPEFTAREFVSAILRRRQNRNAAYSLRAFARDLEIAPAHLSQVLNGKRRLSPDLASRLASKLSLNIRQTEYVWLLTQYEAKSFSTLKDVLKSRLSEIYSEALSAN